MVPMQTWLLLVVNVDSLLNENVKLMFVSCQYWISFRHVNSCFFFQTQLQLPPRRPSPHHQLLLLLLLLIMQIPCGG